MVAEGVAGQARWPKAYSVLGADTTRCATEQAIAVILMLLIKIGSWRDREMGGGGERRWRAAQWGSGDAGEARLYVCDAEIRSGKARRVERGEKGHVTGDGDEGEKTTRLLDYLVAHVNVEAKGQ